jgi:predicted metal-binding membrane protein
MNSGHVRRVPASASPLALAVVVPSAPPSSSSPLPPLAAQSSIGPWLLAAALAAALVATAAGLWKVRSWPRARLFVALALIAEAGLLVAWYAPPISIPVRLMEQHLRDTLRGNDVLTWVATLALAATVLGIGHYQWRLRWLG